MKVFSAIAVQGVVEELVPAFEKEHGCTLDFTWATAPLLLKRLQAGEKRRRTDPQPSDHRHFARLRRDRRRFQTS